MGKEEGYKNLILGRGWNKGQSNKKKYICPVCEKVFWKRIYKKVHAVYCSQKCAYKGRTLGFSKRIIKKPYNCKRKKPRLCIVCQKEFIYRKITQKYCSKKCCDIHKKITSLGKNNPSYKNGSSYKKRSWRGNDWETIRQEVYKRDNYTCRDCGIKCIGRRDANKSNSDRIIQCHHIENYNEKKNNFKTNLITLCLRCHLKRHMKEVMGRE